MGKEKKTKLKTFLLTGRRVQASVGISGFFVILAIIILAAAIDQLATEVP